MSFDFIYNHSSMIWSFKRVLINIFETPEMSADLGAVLDIGISEHLTSMRTSTLQCARYRSNKNLLYVTTQLSVTMRPFLRVVVYLPLRTY
jgi:hypothetical protein